MENVPVQQMPTVSMPTVKSHTLQGVMLFLAGLSVGAVATWIILPKASMTIVTESPSPSVTWTPQAQATPFPAVVIFTPSGRFTDSDKSMIMTRVVQPQLDYYATTGSPVVSVNIELSQTGIFTYMTIHASGANESGVIMKTNGQFDLWAPTHM